MALGRKIGKIIAWIVAVLVVLIAILVIVFLTFDWNRARPWVDDKVSQAIGRQFQITGDLKLGWQRPPSETGWKRPWTGGAKFAMPFIRRSARRVFVRSVRPSCSPMSRPTWMPACC